MLAGTKNKLSYKHKTMANNNSYHYSLKVNEVKQRKQTKVNLPIIELEWSQQTGMQFQIGSFRNFKVERVKIKNGGKREPNR